MNVIKNREISSIFIIFCKFCEFLPFKKMYALYVADGDVLKAISKGGVRGAAGSPYPYITYTPHKTFPMLGA